jgi:hypothetical protein
MTHPNRRADDHLPKVPLRWGDRWTLLLTGPNHGIIGAYGATWPNVHPQYERVNVIVESSAAPVHDADAPSDEQARNNALEEVAKLIDKKVESYDREHGSYDHTTGVTEYPGDGAEWVEEMTSLADEIRAIKSAGAAAKSEQSPDCRSDRDAWKALVGKAVDVLRRHLPPDGISSDAALNELYGIFDGPDYHNIADLAQERCDDRQRQAMREAAQVSMMSATAAGAGSTQDAMAAEMKRLHDALCFWLPQSHSGLPDAMQERIAADAYLLVGYDDMPDKQSAEELGWIAALGQGAQAATTASASGVKPWRQRHEESIGVRSPMHYAEAEIADLRAALARAPLQQIADFGQEQEAAEKAAANRAAAEIVAFSPPLGVPDALYPSYLVPGREGGPT